MAVRKNGRSNGGIKRQEERRGRQGKSPPPRQTGFAKHTGRCDATRRKPMCQPSPALPPHRRGWDLVNLTTMNAFVQVCAKLSTSLSKLRKCVLQKAASKSGASSRTTRDMTSWPASILCWPIWSRPVSEITVPNRDPVWVAAYTDSATCKALTRLRIPTALIDWC